MTIDTGSRQGVPHPQALTKKLKLSSILSSKYLKLQTRFLRHRQLFSRYPELVEREMPDGHRAQGLISSLFTTTTIRIQLSWSLIVRKSNIGMLTDHSDRGVCCVLQDNQDTMTPMSAPTLRKRLLVQCPTLQNATVFTEVTTRCLQRHLFSV